MQQQDGGSCQRGQHAGHAMQVSIRKDCSATSDAALCMWCLGHRRASPDLGQESCHLTPVAGVIAFAGKTGEGPGRSHKGVVGIEAGSKAGRVVGVLEDVSPQRWADVSLYAGSRVGGDGGRGDGWGWCRVGWDWRGRGWGWSGRLGLGLGLRLDVDLLLIRTGVACCTACIASRVAQCIGR